jgi:hypothetical protein
MNRRSLLLGAGAGALALPLALPAGAATLRSVKVTSSAQLPAFRPEWPVPNEPNQLFYLQRSSNSNTVVYTALFDGAGNLAQDRPGQAYWRRYNTDGARKPLKPLEERFAYGVNLRPRAPGEWVVTLKPLPEIPMLLRQTGPGRAELLANIGGRETRAVYAFVEIDESGLIPSVAGFWLTGRDTATGRYLTEQYSVSGGQIRP